MPRLPTSTSFSQQTNLTINSLLDSNTRVSTSTGDDVIVQNIKGENISVSVQELTNALSQEVQSLRSELLSIKSERENELKSNLLTYIQALPEKDMKRLTSDMSTEVLQSIQMLVDAVMLRLGIEKNGPEMLIQQSIGQLAQLCMWQIIVGYKLRELEAFDKGVPLD